MRILLVFAVLVFSTQFLVGEPLVTAKKLATGRLKGKTYSEVNCVQFIRAVLEEELGRALTKVEADAVLIRNVPDTDVSALVAREDLRIRGVQTALVDLIKKGKRIEPENAKPGDFIQFWKKASDGTWEGHAAVIEKLEGNQASLFGSHHSLGDIGTAKYKLVLKQSEDRRIYLARIE